MSYDLRKNLNNTILSNDYIFSTEWKYPTTVRQYDNNTDNNELIAHRSNNNVTLFYSGNTARTYTISETNDLTLSSSLTAVTNIGNNYYVDKNVNKTPSFKDNKRIWNNTQNILNNDVNNSTFIFSSNMRNTNKITESDILVLGGFNFDIPSGATVTSIKIKLIRNSYSFMDSDIYKLSNNAKNTKFLSPGDDYLLRNGITTYTYDSLVTIHDDYNSNILKYKNLTGETISENFESVFVTSVIDCGFNLSNQVFTATTINFNLGDAVYIQTKLYEGYGIVSYIKNIYPGYQFKITNNNILVSPSAGKIYKKANPGEYSFNLKVNNIKTSNNVWSLNDNENFVYDFNDELTYDVVSGSSFNVRLSLKQKLFSGYGFENNYDTKNGITTVIKYNPAYWIQSGFTLNAWSGDYSTDIDYNYTIYGTGDTSISIPNASYIISKLYNVAVKVYYKLNNTPPILSYYDRSFDVNDTINVNDIYFKNQKCLDGVCYSYLKEFNDIYDKSSFTNDRVSLNHMYTEYNIIDKYMSNVYNVDLSSPYNINLNNSYYIIDNIQLKPTQKVLLYNQTNNIENDIYIVNDKYKLDNINYLISRDASFRAKVVVQYGSNKEKQFFLNPIDNTMVFPIFGESKTFSEYHSYILKHLIQYNINNTATATTYNTAGESISNPCKILFTNYDIARTLNNSNRDLYKSVDINIDNDSSWNAYNKIIITYRGLSFYMSEKYNISATTFSTGYTSGITSAITFSETNNILVDSSFYSYCTIGDCIEIKIHNEIIPNDDNLYLVYLTTIQDKLPNNYLVLKDILDEYSINTLIQSGFSYDITIINYVSATTSSYEKAFNLSPFAEVIEATELDTFNFRLKPKITEYYKYFDYSDITITKLPLYPNSDIISYPTSNYTFQTDNQYANYKLKPFFDRFSNISLSTIFNNEILNTWDFNIYESDMNYYNNYLIVSATTTSLYKLENFRPYTYINYIWSGFTMTGKTLVVDVNLDYMIIEKPLNYITGSGDILTIKNIYDFEEISNVLYDVYTNYEHDWYKVQSDNIRFNIGEAYAKILKESSIIRSQSTGMIYHEYNKINFDIFNLNLNSNYQNIFDANFTYYPIELYDVGVDKITKLAKQIEINNLAISQPLNYIILSGNSFQSNYSLQADSYIYNGTKSSGYSYYLGYWSDGFNGSDFIYQFTGNTNSNNSLMCISINNNFEQEKFYVFKSDDWGVSPKGIIVNENKITVFGNILINNTVNSKNNIYYYETLIYSGNTSFNNKIYLSSGKTNTINGVITRFNKNDDSLYSTTLFNQVSSQTLLYVTDVINNKDYEIVAGYYMNRFITSNVFKIGDSITFNYKPTNNSSKYYNRTIGYIYKIENGIWKWHNEYASSEGVDNTYKYEGIQCRNIINDDNDNIYLQVVTQNNQPMTNAVDIFMRNSGTSNNSFTILHKEPMYNYIIIEKLDSNGNIIWNNILKTYTVGSNFYNTKLITDNEYIYSFITYTNNISIYSGNTLLTYHPQNISEIATLIVKYDLDGNLIWIKNIDSGNNATNNAIVDENNIYIVGNFTGILNIENKLNIDQPNTSDEYGFIIKMNKYTNNIIGVKTIICTGYLQLNTVLDDGDFIEIGGSYSGNLITEIVNYSSLLNYFITKIKKDEII